MERGLGKRGDLHDWIGKGRDREEVREGERHMREEGCLLPV